MLDFRQTGLSLVEVLVTLLVISVGLLGIAGLQVTSLRSNATAYHHSQAVWYAYDMADRIRVNRDGIIAGYYSAIAVDGTETSVDCSSACDADTLASYDAYQWGQQLVTLPAGEGMVAVNGDGTYTISVMWDEAGGATGTGCDPTIITDKTCVRIILRP